MSYADKVRRTITPEQRQTAHLAMQRRGEDSMSWFDRCFRVVVAGGPWRVTWDIKDNKVVPTPPYRGGQ